MGQNQTSENRAIESELREKALFPSASAPWQQQVINGLLKKVTFKDDAICLDAACGIGNNIHTLLNHFENIYAFDKSQKAVDFAKNRYNKIVDKGITFESGDLQAIHYQDDFFDCVICTEALEHVTDYNKVIKDIFRITKPCGYVLLSFQNHFNLSAALKYCYEKIYKKNWDAWGTHNHEEGFENYLTCFQVKSSVKKSGFKILEEFGADYINANLSWVPYFYRNYKILDRHPLLPLGKIPLIKYIGMDYFMLIQKS